MPRVGAYLLGADPLPGREGHGWRISGRVNFGEGSPLRASGGGSPIESDAMTDAKAYKAIEHLSLMHRAGFPCARQSSGKANTASRPRTNAFPQTPIVARRPQRSSRIITMRICKKSCNIAICQEPSAVDMALDGCSSNASSHVIDSGWSWPEAVRNRWVPPNR